MEGCGDIVSDNEIIQAVLTFDLGGKTMKKRFLITVLGLTMGSALLFSGCGSKKDTNESSQAVAESTTAAAVKVDINYDIANHLDESYDDIGKAFGDPASDDIKEDAGERLVKYTNPEREFHYYNDGTSGYMLQAVSGKAGDILSFTADKVSLSDVTDQMEAKEEKGLESNEALLTVGQKGDSTVVFESEGYYFVVSVDKDKNITKDSAVAIVTEDKIALDNTGAETKAPSEVKTPETTAAESTTAKK